MTRVLMTLYWDFLDRHRHTLEGNHRLSLQYGNLDRLTDIDETVYELPRFEQDCNEVNYEKTTTKPRVRRANEVHSHRSAYVDLVHGLNDLDHSHCSLPVVCFRGFRHL